MSDLTLALQITLTGMGLVFGAIIVLWGLMYALTAIIRDRKTQSIADQQAAASESTPAPRDEMRAKVAALAVAIAMAEQSTSTAHPLPPPPTVLVSAWQMGMRARQMYQKGSRYKTERR